VEHERAKLNRQKAKVILQTAEQGLTEPGVQAVNLIHKTGFLVDSLEPLEAEADLIVLGKRGEAAGFASGHLGANVDRIVRSSRKPCLVTPGQFAPIERLLLAYDGSKSCQKLLEFLVTSPAFQGLELHILTAAKKADDGDAIAHLKVAERQTQTAGFSPICEVVPGNPEQVIADYVGSHDIHLLLMGAYGHSRIRHLVIGSTTIQLLRSSQIPVLLFR
jgi:nucleotide-binding universal stress UspA family protein